MPSVDKSQLTFGEPARIVDVDYRRRPAREIMECEGCRGMRCRSGTVVGAHPRALQTGGSALKPGDDLILFLGKHCHDEQESAGPKWLAMKILFPNFLHLPPPDLHQISEDGAEQMARLILYPLLRMRYRHWKDAGGVRAPVHRPR